MPLVHRVTIGQMFKLAIAPKQTSLHFRQVVEMVPMLHTGGTIQQETLLAWSQIFLFFLVLVNTA